MYMSRLNQHEHQLHIIHHQASRGESSNTMLKRIRNDIHNFIPLRQLIRWRPLQHLVAEVQMILQKDLQTFLDNQTSPSLVEELLLRDQDLNRDRVVDRERLVDVLDQSRRIGLGQGRGQGLRIVVALSRREVDLGQTEELWDLWDEASVVGSYVGGQGLHVFVERCDVVDYDVDLRG
jgi:hypothetical protein